jgi:AcrR family transcriptional regulator
METVTRAARALFLDQGFSATSMDAIARTAGVSKATVYAYFPNKEALFASLIMAECEGLEHDLPLPNLSEGLYPALQQFARQYARVFIERKDVAFVRTIATIRRLAKFLDEAKARGLLEFEDSVMAATQFLSLIRGERPLRTVLGISDANEQTLDLEIESGLKLFLKACQPADSRSDISQI